MKAAGAGGRLRLFILEVHLHRALPVLAFTAVPLTVHEVIAVAVHFADRRLQVVQIGFYLAIGGVFVAVLAAAVLPAL